MANKDKPVFDNCRAGDIINNETEYYNALFSSESVYEEKDDSEYFEAYRKKMLKDEESDADFD